MDNKFEGATKAELVNAVRNFEQWKRENKKLIGSFFRRKLESYSKGRLIGYLEAFADDYFDTHDFYDGHEYGKCVCGRLSANVPEYGNSCEQCITQ